MWNCNCTSCCARAFQFLLMWLHFFWCLLFGFINGVLNQLINRLNYFYRQKNASISQFGCGRAVEGLDASMLKIADLQ